MDEPIKPNELKKIERDENGLIKGLEYVYTLSGGVDWKAMISKEFLYVNPDPKRRERIEAEYKKPYDQIDPIADKVKDSDLIILLNGLRQLLHIRGHNYVKLTPNESREDYASVNCEISFIPSFESEGRALVHQDNACAHPRNTSNFAQNYLLEIASNRAFCRCIRSFLKINIVSREELGSVANEPEQPKSTMAPARQIKLLDDIMADKGVTWTLLVEKLKKENIWKDEFLSTKDLPKDVVFQFIERIKKMPKV